MSVHQWDLLKGQGDFVGFENFSTGAPRADLLEVRPQHAQHLPAELDARRSSWRWSIAALLDANLRAKTFWRMGVLVPYVVAPVAVA